MTPDVDDKAHFFDDMPSGEVDGLGITIGGASFDPFGPLDAQLYVEPTSFAFDECRDVWAPRDEELQRITSRIVDARKAAVAAQKHTPVAPGRLKCRLPIRRYDFARGYFAPPRPAFGQTFAPAPARFGRIGHPATAAPFRPGKLPVGRGASYADAALNAPRLDYQNRFGALPIMA